MGAERQIRYGRYRIRYWEAIGIKSNEFLGKLYGSLTNQKNQGVYIIRFFNAAGSRHFTLSENRQHWTNEYLENERHYAKDRVLTDEIKASFPNPIDIDGLTRFIADSLDSNKLASCMADFGVPTGTEVDKDKFAKALSIQFGRFVISTESDISNDVWQIYQSLLNGEEINPRDIRGPRYFGDAVGVFSDSKRIAANCYESLRYVWSIQNRGNKEWHGRKLVLVNAGEIYPEIAQTVIPIPDTRPNETIKIATDINAGGFEGKFDCKWEMQDADGENCFPNYTWDFNIQISVTFMEVDS